MQAIPVKLKLLLIAAASRNKNLETIMMWACCVHW